MPTSTQYTPKHKTHLHPALNQSLEKALHSKVFSCYNLAETYFLTNFPRPNILINLRGSSAGVAELQINRLRFNPILYSDNKTEFLHQVIPHEVAHLIAWQVYGATIKPHGQEWQQIMQEVFNCPPLIKHKFCIKRAAKQYYIYSCACTTIKHNFTYRRHQLALAGRKYKCKQCKHFLIYFGLDQGLIQNNL